MQVITRSFLIMICFTDVLLLPPPPPPPAVLKRKPFPNMASKEMLPVWEKVAKDVGMPRTAAKKSLPRRVMYLLKQRFNPGATPEELKQLKELTKQIQKVREPVSVWDVDELCVNAAADLCGF